MTHSPWSAELEFVELFPSRSLVRPGAAGYLHLPQLHWPEPETKRGAQCGQERGYPALALTAWLSGSAGVGFLMVTALSA